MSNFQGRYLVDVVAGATSIAVVTAYIKLRGLRVSAAPTPEHGDAQAWIP